MLLVVIPSSPR